MAFRTKTDRPAHLNELVVTAFDQSTSIIIANFAAALLLFYTLTPHTAPNLRHLFIGATLLGTLIRVAAFVHYKRHYQPSRANHFHSVFLYTLWAAATGWSVGCLIMLTGSDQTASVIIVLYLCILGLGGAYAYGAVLSAAQLTVITLMVPSVLYAVIVGDRTVTLVGIAGLITMLQAFRGASVTSNLNMQALARAKEFERSAIIDSETGIYNHKGFFLKSKRPGSKPATYRTLMIDIDHFKNINEERGQAVGDSVIFCLAQTLSHCCDQDDIYARMGSEEFAVLTLRTAPDDVIALAETIRLRFAKETARLEQDFVATCSIGISIIFQDIDALDAALNNADKQLYQAKRDGRNCVHLER